ncbi:MAG TPA: hypothetical protein VK905_04785 [Bacillota bacterium]|nr:hypothetical protein [Bacillota bacterium]
MLRVNNIKVPLDHRGNVEEYLLRKLGVRRDALISYTIFRESIDARRKGEIYFVYSVDVCLKDEARHMRRSTSSDVVASEEYHYTLPLAGTSRLDTRPAVIGMGPSGIFAALLLSEMGYAPIVLERGCDVDTRAADVQSFWRGGALKPESNVQYGEGGAGTFSDGKLTTMIRDPRCRKVLQTLVSAGAPAEILFAHKPHVGTDLLRHVVKGLRKRIIDQGGEVRFSAHVEDFALQNGRLAGLKVNGINLPVQAAVLAVGHSARDTYQTLCDRGFSLEGKAFSVGARIEHLQGAIDQAQFGALAGHPQLGAAEYKLSFHSRTGRSAYTFCMCPGGLVVAAASEQGRVVTNGMSFHSRAGKNANSALLVGIDPSDFGTHPLAGVALQRQLEEAAFVAGGGSYKALCQKVGDFLATRPSDSCGNIEPSYRPGVTFGELNQALPGYVVNTMREAIRTFDSRLRGFAEPEAVLTGVETRSSAPLRIVRSEAGQSNIFGVYPAGEGAGYAGGIVSAAVDGLRAAEQLIGLFAPPLP